jgi:hypothetical protein
MKPAQVDAAARRNLAQPDPHICHTHDFCDTNIAMRAAFRRYGLDPAAKGGMELWG